MKHKYIRIFLIILTTLGTCFIFAQGSLVSFNFAGNTGIESNVNSASTNPFVLSTQITKVGINNAGNADRFGGSGFTSILNMNKYIEVKVRPLNDCELRFTGISAYLHRSNTGPGNMVIRSSMDNYSSNITSVINVLTTVTLHHIPISLVSTTEVTFRFYFYNASSAGGTGGFDNSGYTFQPTLVFEGTTSCDEPTSPPGVILIDQISSNSFDVNCNGIVANGSIDYSSTGVFLSGNSFMVELSTALGTFPGTVIGTLYSTHSSGQLGFVIPSYCESSSYKIRLKSLEPNYVSNEILITINQNGNCNPIPPHITSLLYDGCNTNTSCDEGQSEIAFGNSGTQSFIVSTANVRFRYDSGNYDLLTNVVSKPSVVDALNQVMNCGTVFINAYNTIIPPNSTFLLASENICEDVFDWSSLCDNGVIYVIFGKENTGNGWKPGGNFGNSGSGKDFSFSITDLNNVTSTLYYFYDNIGSGDGRYATYPTTTIVQNTSGTRYAPSTRGQFINCRLESVALGAELIYFSNYKDKKGWKIIWEILEKKVMRTYQLECYNEEVKEWKIYERIEAVPNDEKGYYEIDIQPMWHGDNVFRLLANDVDGKSHVLAYTSFVHDEQNIYVKKGAIYNPNQFTLNLFSVDGKQIEYKQNGEFALTNHNGFVIVYVNETKSIYRFFLP